MVKGCWDVGVWECRKCWKIGVSEKTHVSYEVKTKRLAAHMNSEVS